MSLPIDSLSLRHRHSADWIFSHFLPHQNNGKCGGIRTALRRGIYAILFCLAGLIASADEPLDVILDRADEIYKTSLPDALQYLENQVETVKTFSIPDQLQFALKYADAHEFLLQNEAAKKILNECYSIPLQGLSGAELERANALKSVVLGNIEYLSENWRESLAAFEQARRYFDTTEDLEMRAYVYSWLGDVQYTSGFYEDGSNSFQEAAKLYDQAGKRTKMAEMLLFMGTSGVAQELEDSMANTLKILNIFEEEGDLVGMAAVYQNMGYDYNSDVNRAIGFFEKSIEICKQVGDIDIQLAAMAGLSEILVRAEKNERAKTVLDEAFGLLDSLDEVQVEAHLSRVAGVVNTALGTEASLAEAELFFNRALMLYRSRGDEELVQAVLEGIAEMELVKGNYELALRISIDVTEWYRRNQEELYPSGLKLLKRIYHRMKDYESELRVTELYWETIEKDWQSGLTERLEILQKDYEATQKKNEIELLEKENLIKNQEIANLQSEQRLATQIRLFGVMLLVALLIIIVVLYFLMRSHQRNMRESQRTSRLLKSQNQELEEANERLKALSEQRKQILGMASHDLKNPLGALSNSLEMLDEDLQPLKDDERFVDALEVLELSIQSVDYMRALIEKMLDSQLKESQSQQLHSERVNPADSMRQMISLNRNAAIQKGIEIRTVFDDSIWVKADAQMVKEVADNLVSNAVKYTPQGGHIEVVLKRDFSDPTFVDIVVADDGPGVPEDEQSRLFEPFTDLSPKPTGGESSNGLGLSITKTLVTAMGGDISFRNRDSGGAQFTVRLPSMD